MTLPLFFALFATSINLLLALLLVAKGFKQVLSVNFFFVLLIIFVAFWSLSLGVSDNSKNIRLSDLFGKATFGFSSLVVSFSYISVVLLGAKKREKKLNVLKFVIPVVLLITPLFFSSLTYSVPSLESFEYDNGIYGYGLYLIIFISLIIQEIRIVLKIGSKIQKKQVTLVGGGLIATIAFVAITNVIVPAVTGSEWLTFISPIASVAYSTLIFYVILRHKLFDFRSVIVRSMTYLFTTFFVVAGYVAVGFFVTHFILPDTKIETVQFISNILLTVVLVLTFPPLKRNFDRLTNKIFFRDSYDPQALIDKLNQTLVTNVQLESLLTKSALVLQENIKNDFCTFYIRETSYFPSRIIGAHRKDPEFEDIDDLENHAAKIHHRVHSVELESDNDNETKLTKVLKKNQIEVMARLVTTLDYDVKGVGYIFMGQKKSGSLYSVQDLKIIEIIANELVIAIENVLRFEEIEQFNVTLQKKIDDATKELKESNDKLKALDEAKDEFVSMASHQLRTPLTSIKGYISMVLEGDAGKISETQAKMLGQAFFSSQRMVYLISDLLNVSRLKTGKFIIESKPVYLPDIVESEIGQLIEGANTKNLTLSFTKPKEFPTLLLDEMKLRQVIMNFSDNAIYYTPSGGKITISLKETPKSVEFTVKDSGIGVPKEQQHKLFVKFYRADNARKARPDGTGLGLFMAKKVIIAQGGSMIFESIEGKGSTFGFSFPKEKLLVDKPV